MFEFMFKFCISPTFRSKLNEINSFELSKKSYQYSKCQSEFTFANDRDIAFNWFSCIRGQAEFDKSSINATGELMDSL